MAIPVTAAFARSWPTLMCLLTGQFGENGLALAETFLPFAEAVSEVARTHADESTRAFGAIALMTLGFHPVAVRHDRWSW